jgi:hypothetical protein
MALLNNCKRVVFNLAFSLIILSSSSLLVELQAKETTPSTLPALPQLTETNLPKLQNLSHPSLAFLVKKTWLNLPTLYAVPKECTQELTWLTNQGLRGLYCHLKPQLSYSRLQGKLAFPIFIKGPHSHVGLNLNSRYSFGFYNKEFVQWLADNAIVGVDNPRLQTRLQPLYQRYLQYQARTFYLAYQYKLDNPKLFKRIKHDYLQHLQQQTLPSLYLQEQFRQFSEDMEKQHYSFYEANTAAGFWLRRSIDKTDDLFFTALQTLLTTYDAEFVFQHRNF